MRKIPGFLTLFLIMSACNDGGGSHDLPEVFHKNYLVKNDAGLIISSDSLEGNGSIALNGPLSSEAKGSRNISLELSLEDGGSVTLLAFADQQLMHALPITIARVDTAISVNYRDASGGTLSADLTLADPNASFRISFDVHNQETGDNSHLIAWQGDGDAPASTNAYLINDEEASAGWGNYLGITLNKAHITLLSFDETKSLFH